MIMQINRNTKTDPVEEIKKWLKDFAKCVQTKNFEQGKTMFSPDCWCFGSYAQILNDLDDLVENQWKQIWPNITDFEFDLNKLHFQFSPDKYMACVMAPWTSVGYHLDGMPYERPGRVSILLTKEPGQGAWLAYHTHYSLNPGTPQLTQRPDHSSQLLFDDILSYNER